MTRTRTGPGADRLYGPAIAAGHAGMWLIWPRTATLMTIVDIGLVAAGLTVVGTALFAPDHISDRAFRLLRAGGGNSLVLLDNTRSRGDDEI